MLKIGMVGAENSHAVQVARLCNVEKQVEARVEMVWGEKAEFAQKTATDARIPTIVKDWREMLGKVDGVMIECMSFAEVKALEHRFTIFTGSVDLLAMANVVPPELFRAYITACREMRAARRGGGSGALGQGAGAGGV